MTSSENCSLSPPFQKELSLVNSQTLPASIPHNGSTLRPSRDSGTFLSSQVHTPKLDRVHHHLWLAGLPRPARPLHRQRLLQRTITITEDPNEHLVWKETRIYIKPLPCFLLNFQFWLDCIYEDIALHKGACGLLLSYSWLVSYESDLTIALEEGLIPKHITWAKWVLFIDDFLDYLHRSGKPHEHISLRYTYGELRLSRLSAIYRFFPPVLSARSFVYGFMSGSSWYKEYFEQHFAWLLAVFAYVTVVLSAMQVGLATEHLSADLMFQQASYGFAVASIVAVAALIGVIMVFWTALFFYSLLSTRDFIMKTEKERKHEKEASSG